MDYTQQFSAAKSAAALLAITATPAKDAALLAIADALIARTDEILAANARDIDTARQNSTTPAIIDRLTLTPARIAGIAAGIREVVALPDPIGVCEREIVRPNGLRVGTRRVPLGVIGIIYENRPNVTVDAAVLCLKSGNACVLRGSRSALHSDVILADIMREAVAQSGLPADSICLLADTTREGANAMMTATGYIDLLIPRGGAGLIRAVVDNATVPVVETGVGVCHVYAHAACDFDMAADIIVNAKTSRPSVCNAAETLLADAAIAQAWLPLAADRLWAKGVELRGCPRTCAILGERCRPATQDDYYEEYLDLTLAVRVVGGIDEAIEHIHTYGTHHSEAIVTGDYAVAQDFLHRVDAAAVYVNASTRFTDGNEFGLGAEMGISNQKVHARGPMGLTSLTSIKYVIYGNGQVR